MVIINFMSVIYFNVIELKIHLLLSIMFNLFFMYLILIFLDSIFSLKFDVIFAVLFN